MTARALEQMLTPDDVAQLIQKSRDTVMRRIHSGEIPAANVGTRARPSYVIRPSDLNRWIDSHRYTP